MRRVIAMIGLGVMTAVAVGVASPTAAGADPLSDFLCNSGSAEYCAMPDEASPPDAPEKAPKAETPDWESLMKPPENPFYPGCPMPGYPRTPGKPISPLCPTNPAYPACPPYAMYSQYSANPFCPKPPYTPRNPYTPYNPYAPNPFVPKNPFVDYLN